MANHLSFLRKSYFGKVIFCSIFSNLFLFGEPMQEMVLSYVVTKNHSIFIGNSSGYFAQENEQQNMLPDAIAPDKGTLPEVSRHYYPTKGASIFYAKEERAIVGADPLSGIENPYDNFFTVHLPENQNIENYEVVMAYDLYGVSGAEQTTKRVNNHPAYGGKIVSLTNQWISVSEILPTGYLQVGTNEIFFNRRTDERYHYEVKNLRIELKAKSKHDIALPAAAIMNENGSLHFVAAVPNPQVTEVEILGELVPVNEGVLERVFVNIPKEINTLQVTYKTGTGVQQMSIPVVYSIRAPQFSFTSSTSTASTVKYESLDFNKVQYDSLAISVDKEKAPFNSQLTVTGLQFKDLKVINEDVENVTAGRYQGYRIQKINIPDSVGIRLHMKYDPEKIPTGYTEQDIRTFFYDVAQRSWNMLPIDSLDVLKHEVIVTAYGNDTDYINGVIKVPGSPETNSFAPTAMTDIKLADPGAGVVSIAPPSPNHTGSAGTSFPLKLPAGRNGVQPSLQVSYNSEAGNGWMGIGWNISTPAITLNTKWGVPVFGADETEMYTLNGVDLVLNHNGEYTTPNRTAGISRGPADRQFYERKESSYNQIIRKGNSPANYYWEVTDKMGNKSYYGGYDNNLDNGCVIRTGGLSSGNVAHWALKRTEDTYGNYVEYIYEKSTEDVNGVTAQSFYISEIKYTLKGLPNTNTNYYSVKFIRNATRVDKTTNARSGFVQVINNLLSEVQVYFVNNGTQNLIRKYSFTYYGAQDAAVFSNPFNKSVLKSISEYDAAENLFYSHSMEYYNEVGTGAIIDSGVKAWTGEEDSVSPLGVLSGIALGTQGSALGTSTSVGGTGGFRVGFGLGFNVLSTAATVGGSANYSYNESNTQVSFMDINGDGLPDKVYKNGSTIRYRPNLGLINGTTGQFGNYINISGISKLGKTTSNTIGYGADLNLVVVGIGTSGSDTWSQTDHYFNDFNGDGLPDMVTDGQIKFNATSGTDPNYRTFSTNVTLTENNISPGQMSTQVLATMDLPTEEELRASYPQFDHVKVWEAPYTGTIQISGTASLTPLTCNSSNIFRFTIERKHMVNGEWVTSVLGTPVESSSTSGLTIPSSTLIVNKGDLLFFRVHNKQYGCGGRVRWNPTITYQQSAQTVLYYNGFDENGKNVSSFSYASDYMVNNGGTTDVGGAPVNVSFDFNLIAGTLTSLNLSDAVRFTVQRIRYNVQDSDVAPIITTYQRIFTPGTGLSGNGGSNALTISMNSNLGTNQRDVLYCYVDSDSNVDWAALKWQPKYTVTGSSVIKYPGVTYIPFNDNVAQQKYWTSWNVLPTPVIDTNNPADNNTPFMIMSHNFNQVNWQSYLDLSNTAGSNIIRRKVSWVVKKRSSSGVTVMHKKTFYLNKSGINYTISRNADGTSVLNPGDADYNSFFSLSLSKLDVKTIKDQTAVLYSAFYIDNALIGGIANNYNPATILLALHPAMASNPLYSGFTSISLPSPFLAQNSQFYGCCYRGWGQFLYNGGINSSNQSDYGMLPIEANLFDGQSQSDTAQAADQAGSNTTPDDVSGMSSGMTVRYTLYQQLNESNRYAAPSIKYRTPQGDVDATFGYDSSNQLVATMGRFGIADIYSQYVNVNDLATGSGSTFVGLKQYSESHGSATSANGGLPMLSAAGTFSHAQSKLNNQYLDFNGDRYPDLVTPGAIQFTGMNGGFTSVTQTSGIHSSGSRSEEQTFGATISGLFPNSTKGDDGVRVYDGTNTQANSGINDTSGKTKNGNLWVDVNGDGLPDKVYLDTDGSRVGVNLNTGYGFSAQETNWITNLGGMDISSNSGGSASLAGGTTFPTTSFAIGLGTAKSTSNAETIFLDVNGDGLTDLVRRDAGSYKYHLNTGTAFSSTAKTFCNTDLVDQDRNISGNLFGSYTWGFAIPIPLTPIALKTTFTPTLSATAGFSEKCHTLQDIDGDGLVDVLNQSGNSNANVTASLNKVGKTYLLKRVHTALGGSWTINYTRDGNTYNMPQSKWVLSSIETDDGFTADNNFGPSKSKATVMYANPKYNRREREFFGYGSVTVQEIDLADQSTYRTVVTSYHNENYYLSGAQKSRILYDNSLQVLSEENTLYNLLNPDTPVINPSATVENNFLQATLIPSAAALLDKSRLFVAIAKVTSTSYEGSQSLTTQKHFLSYDGYGNLKELRDDGEDPEDAYKTVIEYHPVSQYVAYGPGYPKKISVYKNADNVLMREREATYYTGTGGLYEIKTKLNTVPEYNIVQLEYDVYGNVIKVNDLENKNAANTGYFSKTITYETTLNMFPASISNSFGDISYFEQYNYRFGVPALVKDVNSQYMRTRIDNRGRVIEVTGPNEMAVEAQNAGNAWTIRMEYENEAMLGTIPTGTYMVNAAGSFAAVAPGSALPTNKKHYALTRHFDPEYATGTGLTSTNQLLTVSLVDGFGKPIQVKKTHQTDSAMKWMVSGFEKKDAFGRVLQSYLPIVEAGYPANPTAAILPSSTIYNYNTGSAIQPFTIMTYDAKDRVKTVKQVGLTLLPGETDTATMEYAIEDGMYVQKLTNERGQTLDTYTDIRGRNRKTVQNQEITTTFHYNAISELLKVVDDENFETEYIYDLAGRKTEVRHPDRGVVTFKYDKASRMTEQSNSNLLPNNQKITYFYDCSRLVRVEYPQNPQNQIKYTYGLNSNPLAVSERAVGRLLVQEDATGMQLFGYGRMGEMIKNLRSVAVANYQSFWFFTQWKYDSWNRVQEIIYPDQETVSYVYNKAMAIQGMNSQMANIAGGVAQPVISSIAYNDFGERASITHGSGTTATTTTYGYDVRRRMNSLTHAFPNTYSVSKGYTYDALSNITDIITNNPVNSLPANGKIGGPVKHHYDYDAYNRLVHADGVYTGANDFTTPYLRTTYTLDMEYNTNHTIKKKTQLQQQGYINAYTDNVINEIRPVKRTSYVLDYGGYGDAALTTGNYGYQQPHAPRAITEGPGWVNTAPDDPRVKEKKILYDANGNQTEIKEVLGDIETSLRKNLWDEENRLRAVNLKPDDPTTHPIAIYTYDAAGERTVRYNYDRIDVSSNATEVGQAWKDNVMIYPSGLIMGKPTRLRKEGGAVNNTLAYTKHYYIGSERVSAKTGTLYKIGDYPQDLVNAKMPQMASQPPSLLRTPSTNTQAEARQTVIDLHVALLGAPPVPAIPAAQEEPIMVFGGHDPSLLNIYYHHADHLGSSSYITNGAGVVCQHMEYLPFGETLIDEHLNSNNSPFKFNGKEFDEETGNYYYSARYYDPKLSIFISVDPLAEKTMDAYGYCYQNPVNFVDPTGMKGDDVYIIGSDSKKALKQLDASTSLNITRDKKTGKLSATGEAKTDADKELLNAINDECINVILNATDLNTEIRDGEQKAIIGGSFGGSKIEEDGTVTAFQMINPKQSKIIEGVTGAGEGIIALHEVLEAYIGAKESPGANLDNREAYENAHNKAESLDPRRVNHKYSIDQYVTNVNRQSMTATLRIDIKRPSGWGRRKLFQQDNVKLTPKNFRQK